MNRENCELSRFSDFKCRQINNLVIKVSSGCFSGFSSHGQLRDKISETDDY